MTERKKIKKGFFRRIFNFRGLAFRSGCFFFSGVFLILMVAFVYIVVYAAEMMMDQGKKEASTTTDLTIGRILGILQPIEEVTGSLASSISTEDPDFNSVLRLSKDYVITNPTVYGSCLAFEPYQYSKGLYYYAPYFYETPMGLKSKILGNERYDYFTQPWYSQPKKLQKAVWSDPYFDLGGGNTMMCTYSAPFFFGSTNKPEFKGVLTMDVSLKSLEMLVSGVHIYESGFAMLVSNSGKVLTCPNPEYVNGDLREITKEITDKAEMNEKGKVDSVPDSINQSRNAINFSYKIRSDSIVEKIIRGESGFANAGQRLSRDGGDLIYYAPVGKTGWSLIVVFSADELLSGLIGFLKKLGTVILASMIAALIITILIVKRFTRPIRKLADAAVLIGHGDFHAPLPVIRSKNEIGQLSKSFAAMQVELQNYLTNLRETTSAKEKIESELKVAHEIQVGMLPTAFPRRNDCDLFAILEPAKAVGGDLYDFFLINKDYLYFAVGDVSGKGVPASLFMAITRTLFRAKAAAGIPLGDLFQSINIELCKDNPNVMFVTFQAAILNLKTGEVEICNAGHNLPIMIRNDGKVEKKRITSNIPLGINDTASYRSENFKLQPGDMLVFYTDGITEAINANYELYREEKFLTSITALLNLPARETATRLIMDVKSFSGEAEQSDDITLLVMKFNGQLQGPDETRETIRVTIRNDISEINKIAESLDAMAGKYNLSQKVITEINLAMEELVVNIISYAYKDEKQHEIEILISLMKNTIRIEISDDGQPFNLLDKVFGDEGSKPLEERKIGGLGIHFIKTMMNHIEYQRTESSNRVILIKNL